MNTHYANFEYKGMKTVGVTITDYTTITQPKYPKGAVDVIMSKRQILVELMRWQCDHCELSELVIKVPTGSEISLR